MKNVCLKNIKTYKNPQSVVFCYILECCYDVSNL